MRNIPNVKIEKLRLRGPAWTNTGAFMVPCHRELLCVISSDGGGWDHVSISLPNRCPTWAEMDFVKSLFFKDDEVVMQLHVSRSDHVNNHPFCLHLWRPQSTDELATIRQQWGDEWPAEYPVESVGSIPLPPAEFVGLKELNQQPDAAGVRA